MSTIIKQTIFCWDLKFLNVSNPEHLCFSLHIRALLFVQCCGPKMSLIVLPIRDCYCDSSIFISIDGISSLTSKYSIDYNLSLIGTDAKMMHQKCL